MIMKSKNIYARTGGGYIKVREFLKKNMKIQERKSFGVPATKHLGKASIKPLAFGNITLPKRLKQNTPREVHTKLSDREVALGGDYYRLSKSIVEGKK